MGCSKILWLIIIFDSFSHVFPYEHCDFGVSPLHFFGIFSDGFWNRLRPRYYTIYDLANKRIGLALARQPVGQATVADVENGVNLRPILRP